MKDFGGVPREIDISLLPDISCFSSPEISNWMFRIRKSWRGWTNKDIQTLHDLKKTHRLEEHEHSLTGWPFLVDLKKSALTQHGEEYDLCNLISHLERPTLSSSKSGPFAAEILVKSSFFQAGHKDHWQFLFRRAWTFSRHFEEQKASLVPFKRLVVGRRCLNKLDYFVHPWSNSKKIQPTCSFQEWTFRYIRNPFPKNVEWKSLGCHLSKKKKVGKKKLLPQHDIVDMFRHKWHIPAEKNGCFQK